MPNQPTTLYEYYTQQGLPLPSISERAKLYEQFGLGSASEYRGTAEQNTALLRKLLETKTVPQVAGQLAKTVEGQDLLSGSVPPKEIAPPEYPSDLEALSSIFNLEDRSKVFAGILGAYVKELQETKTALEEARKKQEEYTAKMESLLARPTKTELLEEAKKEVGWEKLLEERDKLYNEIMAIQNQIAAVRAEQEEALAKSEARKAPMAFIRGEQAEIQKRYETRIANLNAQLGHQIALYQAKSGEIDDARRWINDIVNAATYDLEFEYRVLSQMGEIYRNEINELGREYRNLFNQIVDLTQQELTTRREELMRKVNLNIEVARAGGTPLSFETLKTMSLEQMADYAAKEIRTRTLIEEAETPAGVSSYWVDYGLKMGLSKNESITFAKDIAQLIKDVYLGGRYGVEFAREKALLQLKLQYPNIPDDKLGEIIYKHLFPDGYERNIMTKTTTTAIGIPTNEQIVNEIEAKTSTVGSW